MNTDPTVLRWQARALRAENKLRQVGAMWPSEDGFSDDEYLCIVLRHKDESKSVHIDELNEARRRTGRIT